MFLEVKKFDLRIHPHLLLNAHFKTQTTWTITLVLFIRTCYTNASRDIRYTKLGNFTLLMFVEDTRSRSRHSRYVWLSWPNFNFLYRYHRRTYTGLNLTLISDEKWMSAYKRERERDGISRIIKDFKDAQLGK